MKILMLTWGCDLEDISEPEVTAKWVKEISKDHDVTLFSVSLPERYGCVQAQFPELKVIEWRDISVPKCLQRVRSIIKPAYFLYFKKIRGHLKKLISEGDYDLIHHVSPFAWRYPSPAVGLGLPVVRGPVAGGLATPKGLARLSLASFSPFSLLRKTDRLRMLLDCRLRESYQSYDHLLVAGNYMYDFLRPLPAPKQMTTEVEHGLTRLPIEHKVVTDKPIVNLLFVGRIVKFKGLDYAIRALAQSKNRDKIHLTVVGNGPEHQNCVDLAQSIGLSSQISFVGWVPKHDVISYYNDADVFIFPSYQEPSGAVFMEALSYGLPVITCNYGGADYMVDERSGIKVEPASDSSYVINLALAIDRLVEDVDFRQMLSIGAIARARDFFSWENKRKRMTSVYLSTVKQYEND